MMNSEDMFSLFISFIAIGLEKANSPGDMMATVACAVEGTGFRLGPPRVSTRNNRAASSSERIVFDIEAEDVLLRDCDIEIRWSDPLAVVNLGMPQHTLLLEQVRDCARKEGLIWNVVLGFFSHDEIVTGKVAVEDSFAPEALDAFHPGDWNVFREGRVPDYLSEVRPQGISEEASFYTREQICALGIREEEMGLSLVRALGLGD